MSDDLSNITMLREIMAGKIAVLCPTIESLRVPLSHLRMAIHAKISTLRATDIDQALKLVILSSPLPQLEATLESIIFEFSAFPASSEKLDPPGSMLRVSLAILACGAFRDRLAWLEEELIKNVSCSDLTLPLFSKTIEVIDGVVPNLREPITSQEEDENSSDNENM